jgi:hypothetical protein
LIGKTAWQCKLSFGKDWGDEGYMYLVGEVWDLALYSLSGPAYSWKHRYDDILCVDNDNDGYYSWGIGPKPRYCPECPDEPDGDDTDPCIGPMNEYGFFSSTTPAPDTHDTLILTGMDVPDLYAAGEQIRWYSDRRTDQPGSRWELHLPQDIMNRAIIPTMRPRPFQIVKATPVPLPFPSHPKYPLPGAMIPPPKRVSRSFSV